MRNDTANPGYGKIDKEYGRRLATTPPAEDGPVWMLNLMKYHTVAQYADDRDVAISGQEADDLYSPVDVLAEIGAEPVFFADVDTQLLGESPMWDRVAVVKYPTRRSFIDMQSRPDFQAKHVHSRVAERTGDAIAPDCHRRPVAKRLVRTVAVVKRHPHTDPGPRLPAVGVALQIDVLIFQAAP